MANIQNLSLEDIMGERFGRYSKYIIQERALPDIRDGLKPVQRRILYSMYKDGNTFDKGYRKSAKSVGNIMGNFHPHGDSSIYDAMVRLSQDWKMRDVLVEMHGNNGNMDGDAAAAMRYTEARLSEVAGVLLTDIDKQTVPWAWNFDDTEKEPTVLPAAFPNLLVNGSTGISAGYATDIPPHNMQEVIDAVIYMIDKPQASVSELMTLLPGPDFPTGGIIQGKDAIKSAYETGKGRLVLRSKIEVEALKAGKEQLVITEIPYEVNKANLVKKIDEVRINNKVAGIVEVRDETDLSGLRIVVELKKDADRVLVENYLLKYTDLQINYNFNMVAIDNQKPKQVGLLDILSSYIAHRKDIIEKRSQFDLEKAQARAHIVSGLIRVLSILDEVIALIRASDNKSDAKANLQASYQFSELQAEAIVTLQLYRLTNTDIVTLEQEAATLADRIAELEAILADPKRLLTVMKSELRAIKKQFATDRRSRLEDQVTEIAIEASQLITQEDVWVSVTSFGYVKRTSLRSYSASSPDEIGKRDDDQLALVQQANTTQKLMLLTNLGHFIYRPINELPDIKWKDPGEHLSQTISAFDNQERIIYAQIIEDKPQEATYVAVSQAGQIKRLTQDEFSATRTYRTKSSTFMKLKSADDRVVLVDQVEDDDSLMLVTYKGYGLRFQADDVPILGSKAAGVKAINLKDEDHLASAFVVKSDRLYLLTQRGAFKNMAMEQIPITSRANRGLQVLRELKKAPHRVFAAGNSLKGSQLHVVLSDHQDYQITLADFANQDRTNNGSFINSSPDMTVLSSHVIVNELADSEQVTANLPLIGDDGEIKLF